MFVGNVHFVTGGVEALPRVFSMLAEAGIQTKANPDVSVREYLSFGIDDARELMDKAGMRALGSRRVFVVVFGAITNEAQNALLKTLEEAPGDALFIFISPSPQTLLPTVRSRGLVHQAPAALISSKSAEEFLAAAPGKRLDMLKTVLEKNGDDKRDLGAIIAFLSQLERHVSTAGNDAGAREGIRAIWRARCFISDRGALVKPLLEQVALLV